MFLSLFYDKEINKNEPLIHTGRQQQHLALDSNMHSQPNVRNFKLVVYDGVVVSTVSSQQEGLGFESQLRPFCVEFACFPCVCVCGFSPGAPVSSYVPKTCFLIEVNWSIYIVRRCVRVNVCLSLSVSAAIGWWPIQGVPHLSPLIAGMGSSRPLWPKKWKEAGTENGWIALSEKKKKELILIFYNLGWMLEQCIESVWKKSQWFPPIANPVTNQELSDPKIWLIYFTLIYPFDFIYLFFFYIMPYHALMFCNICWQHKLNWN